MATLKQRLHRYNGSSYDIIHFETDASIITGTLPISHGGTGATTAADALTALGAVTSGQLQSYLPLSGGTMTGNATMKTGTDYTTFRARNIGAGTTAYTAGSTSLTNGNIYLQYE